MKKTNQPKVTPTKKTKFAKYKAIQTLGREKVGEMESKNASLKLQSRALASHIQKRLNPKKLSRQDRGAAEKLVAKQIQPISSIIEAIRNNMDRPTQEKFQANFDAIFKSDKQFESAMLNYMKGQENAQFTKFLMQLSQLVATQEGSRITQIQSIQADKAVVKAEKVVKQPLVRLADMFTPKGKKMKAKDVVEKMKGDKALFSRKGGEEEVVAKKGIRGKFFSKKAGKATVEKAAPAKKMGK